MNPLEIFSRIRRVRFYDTGTHGTYDFGKQLVLGSGQSTYDPQTFGRYDRATQKVVPLDAEDDGFWALRLDESQPFAVDHLAHDPMAVLSDRYEIVLSLLGPGEGLCLDACTGSPDPKVVERVRGLGFDYQAIDLDPSDNSNVRREDVTALTFESGSVARILSLDTLEHVPGYEAALREFERVLVPGGLLFLHVPAYFFDREDSAPLDPEQDPWGHVRYFSARELVRNVMAAGLAPRRVQLHLDYGAVLCIAGKPAHR